MGNRNEVFHEMIDEGRGAWWADLLEPIPEFDLRTDEERMVDAVMDRFEEAGPTTWSESE